jgi:hypothetical protein
MGVGATLYRKLFLKNEVSRSGYPFVDQSKLSNDETFGKTNCASAADTSVVRSLHIADKDSDQAIEAELRKDMGTRPIGDPNPGTEPDELIKGTEKYFKDHGKNIKSTWQGWGAGQTTRKGSSKIPKFNFIARLLAKANQQEILQVGMYKKTSDGNFERVSGHYVTCTGYKKNGLKLKIADPAPRASRKEEVLATEELKKGELKAGTKKTTAKGYTQIKGLDLVEGADIAIIDGVYSYQIAA